MTKMNENKVRGLKINSKETQREGVTFQPNNKKLKSLSLY